MTELSAKSQGFIHAAKAPNTLRASQFDWQDFTAWCSLHQLPHLPATPEIVALYITSLSATHSAGTITRRLTSIAKTHEVAGHPSPATMRHAQVSETLKGIRRTLVVGPKGKTPLLTADIQKILGRLPDNLRGTRDAALFLVGFAGAFRRSELAALNFEDLVFGPEGLVISLGRSKTDPEGKGRKVAVPLGSHRNTCPLRALQKWLEAAQISSGPLFRPVSSHGKVEDKKLHKDSIARECSAQKIQSSLVLPRFALDLLFRCEPRVCHDRREQKQPPFRYVLRRRCRMLGFERPAGPICPTLDCPGDSVVGSNPCTRPASGCHLP